MSLRREMGRQKSPPEEMFSVGEYIEEIHRLGKENGFRIEPLGTVADFSLPVLIRDSGAGEWLYVSTGSHGDEPAGPLAIRAALEMKGFSESFNWMVFPVLNPTGLAAGTRENEEGIDINRDYKALRSREATFHRQYLQSSGLRFLAALGLHEDWEAQGGYLYEHNPENVPHPGGALLHCIEKNVGLELGAEIDGWPTDGRGLIHPPSNPDMRDTWPEQIFLLHHHTGISYTVETPSLRKLAARVECHVEAIQIFGCRSNWISV